MQRYLFILLTVACSTIYAQRYDSLLAKIDNLFPQEKMYLQFDRSVYFPGETVWFKACIFEGNYPSLISKTVYAELADPNGKVLQRVTLPIINSAAAGSFEIPANASGQLFVRSYTKWMLNFDSSLLCTKSLSIISSTAFSGDPSVSSQEKINSLRGIPTAALQFFPEGGDLIQGIESRLAFKSMDIYGLPVDIAGDIYSDKGRKITSFSSIHDGMGTFLLQPVIGEQYKAVWQDKQGQTHESFIPMAKQSGVVLSVNNFLKHIDFKITSSNRVPYSYVYIVAQMNQQLLYIAKANLTNTPSTGIIPIANISPGIVQLTVFAPDEQPLAERIVFANPAGYAFITNLGLMIKDFGKRKKNIIQIDVPDTIACNLSVSVTDADIGFPEVSDNIYSHLLLTADIRGYIHNAAYYFSNKSDSVASHLDLVMMTNGWRRFKWEDVLAGNFPKINYTAEDYISIHGQVLGSDKTVAATRDITGVVELKNGNRQLLNIPVQKNGGFSVSGLIFFDTAKFFYQLNNQKNKKITSGAIVEITNDFLKNFPHMAPGNSVFFRSKLTDTTLIIRNVQAVEPQFTVPEVGKIKTLKTVVISAPKKSQQEMIDAEYTSGLFSGGVAHTFMPETDSFFFSSKNVFNFLRGKIAGLQITPRYEVTWRGYPTYIFINERREEDLTYVLSIRMNEIAMIKVFNPPFYGAIGGGPGGALAIYLKKGAQRNESLATNNYVILHGYSPVKEFYSPDYSKAYQADPIDYRKTLYWNPFVFIDKDHRTILLPFYNNDITKKMKIIIEGFNADGRLTRIEKTFE